MTITVHVIYDPAVLYIQSEWDDQALNLQSIIESPLIYMRYISSSLR